MSGIVYPMGMYGAQQPQQDPETMRRMMMAQMLMGQNNQGAMGGMANAGNSIAGAIALKNMQDQQNGQQFMQDRMKAAGTPMQSGIMQKLGGMFNLGGGQ